MAETAEEAVSAPGVMQLSETVEAHESPMSSAQDGPHVPQLPPVGKKSADLPAATRSLLFPPTSAKSRPAAGFGTRAAAAASNMRTLPRRSYNNLKTGEPLQVRFWKAIQRGTGFAVGTERVLDSRVRRAQQIKALRIMAMNTAATLIVMVVVLAIP